MNFRQAVAATPAIRDQLQNGLRAVRNVDRGRLRCSATNRLRGSVDVDEALRAHCPNDPRWDYAIGMSYPREADHVVWLEVHPASSGHIAGIMGKLQWLKCWLATDAKALRQLRPHFCWVATRAISFRRGGKEEKMIAQQGLRFPTKHLNLDEF